MIAELAGFTLTRSIPDKVLLGVLSGGYKVLGGVVRNDMGQIVAHLVHAAPVMSMMSGVFPPLGLAVTAFNTYQLHGIGKDIATLMGLVKGTMMISGLTLAVSSAGFVFLGGKLNRIEGELKAMSADIKSIKVFLEYQERARLISALKALREINEDVDTRRQILINSRQTLGEIHEKYKSLLIKDKSVSEFIAAEEYFTITAIGHALCSAELGMCEQAKADLVEAQSVWKVAATTFVDEKVLGSKPQRLLDKKYLSHVSAEQIVQVMDFAKGQESGVSRLDELRGKSSFLDIRLRKAVQSEEATEIGVARKLVERDKVLLGYVDQYRYLAANKLRPSEVQQYFDSLPTASKIGDGFIFVANEHIK